MAKKPVSLLHLHEFLRKVWDERDKSKDDWDNGEGKEGEDGQKKGGKKESADDSKHGENKNAELGPGSMLSHQTDIFHPDNLVNTTRNFPTLSNVRLSQLEAGERALKGEEEEAAKLFFLSQGVTFQHLVLMQKYKQKSAADASDQAKQKTRVEEGSPISNEEDEEASDAYVEKDGLKFANFQATDVSKMLKDLPASWTVVQISVNPAVDPALTRFQNNKKDSGILGNPALVVIRAEGSHVTVSNCPGPSSVGCSPVMKEFTDILAENTHVNRNEKDRKKYWAIRKELDDRLVALLKSMEERWLGVSKVQLLGQLKEVKDKALVDKVMKEHCPKTLTEEKRQRLRTVISGACFLSKEELEASISKVLDSSNISPAMLSACSKLSKLKESSRHPVIFILDPRIQSLPWESLPCLTSCKQPASRVPSLSFLHTLWQAHAADSASVVTMGVASDNVFYVVNPDGNLPETQTRLDKAFQDYQQWEGVAGVEPAKEVLEKVLQKKDAYMFCGHGSGTKFISGDEVEKLRVHAVPLLLGCSSGQLARHGRNLDPLGTAQNYLLASSPALLGFLWAVTDADVDQWTVVFLQHWLGGKKDGQSELLQASADKRSSFKNFLNGAALVVYGLPLKSKK